MSIAVLLLLPSLLFAQPKIVTDVNHGGTKDTTFIAHALLVGNGQAAIDVVAPGALGLPLVSQGLTANPSYSPITIPAGGTGITATVRNDMLVSRTPNTMSRLAGGVNTQVVGINGDSVQYINNGATIAMTETDLASFATNQNNLVLSSWVQYFTLHNVTGGFINLTGIVNTGSPVGRQIVLVNYGPDAVVIMSNSASSVAAAQFQTNDGEMIIMARHGSVTMVYDGLSQKFQLTSK